MSCIQIGHKYIIDLALPLAAPKQNKMRPIHTRKEVGSSLSHAATLSLGPEQLNHSWVVEFDTSIFYSISLYECTITTRDEPEFGELKLTLRVRGLLVTTHDYTDVLLPVARMTQASSTS